MTYLLSLLTDKSKSQDLTKSLCYYINDTNDIQIVRVMDGVICCFECIIFAKEHILFEALPESYLEIHSSPIEGATVNRISCKLLCVNDASYLTSSNREWFADTPSTCKILGRSPQSINHK